MQVILAALGGGAPETLTAEAAGALRGATHIFGAPRLLAALPEGCAAPRTAATRPEALLALLEKAAEEDAAAGCVVVYSGDTGFYSGANGLGALLRARSIPFRVLPGVSSVQLLAARLARPWQGWALVSAHGRACDPVREVCGGRPVCFLTGGAGGTPGELCAALAAAGLGTLPVTVGENLASPGERITAATAAELAGRPFAPLSVLLAEPAPRTPPRTPGLPDEAFRRGKVPMTKREVRAAALARLGVRPGETVWDVGAGTGSVSVELALAGADVYAVECGEEGCALIEENRKLHGAWTLHLVRGLAPGALAGLPKPDAVFIGGSKGKLSAIVDAALAAAPDARVCITAIALETLGAAAAALAAHGLAVSVTQIAVTTARPAGSLHLMLANNPVFLIAGNCE